MDTGVWERIERRLDVFESKLDAMLERIHRNEIETKVKYSLITVASVSLSAIAVILFEVYFKK